MSANNLVVLLTLPTLKPIQRVKGVFESHVCGQKNEYDQEMMQS